MPKITINPWQIVGTILFIYSTALLGYYLLLSQFGMASAKLTVTTIVALLISLTMLFTPWSDFKIKHIEIERED